MNTQIHSCSTNAQKTKKRHKQDNVMTQHNMLVKCLICYRVSLTTLD